VTPGAVAALVLLAAGLALSIGALVRSERRRRLGLAHPALAWILLSAVFFAAGSVVLAAGGRPGPSAYTGGALLAFAAGLAGSDEAARRRTRTARAHVSQVRDPGLRSVVVAGLAVLGLAAVTPTLIESGLPFLTRDITGSRAELGGLSVQVLRITLPAASGVALLLGLRAGGRTAVLAAVVVAAIAGFELLIASRYLLAELAGTLILAAMLAGHRIPLRVVAPLAAGGLVLFLGIQLLRAYDLARGREAAFLAERTVGRIVLIQPRTMDALMTVIPAEQPYFNGLTWVRRLAPLAGRDDVPNLGYWIYPRVVGGAQSVAGYAAPGWLGEAWANFGWAGLSLFAILGLAVERLAGLIAWRRSRFKRGLIDADAVAAGLAVLFVARTHALGVNGLAVVLTLVAVWRLLVAPSAGLLADVRATLAWRT
jgi:hypothetical protein